MDLEQNRYVFNRPLNPDSESSWRYLERKFQAEGAEKQKLQFPNRFDRVREMRSIPEAEELKEAYDGSMDACEILVEWWEPMSEVILYCLDYCI